MVERKMASRKIFSFCLLFSICTHAGALVFFQNFFFFHTTPYSRDKGFAAAEKILPSKREDSPILRFSLHTAASSRGRAKGGIATYTPASEKEEYGTIRTPALLEKKESRGFVSVQFSTKHREEKKEMPLPKISTSSLKKEMGKRSSSLVNLFPKNESKDLEKKEEEKKPLTLVAEVAEVEEKSIEKVSFQPIVENAKLSSPALAEPVVEPTRYTSEISPFRQKNPIEKQKKIPFSEVKTKGALLHQKPRLAFRMPTSSDLHIVSCSQDFDVDLVYNFRNDGEGYLFALSLIPKSSLSFQKIPQNYLFFIDRSHSIGEERFYSAKAAVYSALSLLEKEDTFNIIIFDHHTESLFEKNMPVSSFTIRHAKEFLEKQKVGGMFASTNVSRPLFLGTQQLLKEHSSKVIIYLSNGDTLDKAGHKKALRDWTEKNKGEISFYSLFLKDDKKGAILDYISSINKGKAYAIQTAKGFKRQLRKIIHSIHSPLAQKMEAYVYLMKEGTEVNLFPSLCQMPNLYLNQPFVLMGTCKKLEPFTLFLQGKSKDQWFHVKKEVAFQNAREATQQLYEEWALMRAYRCYDAYLLDGNTLHLREARSLLSPYSLEEAFQ